MLSTIKHNTLLIGFIITVIVTVLVYSNHFHNPFFFDDSHTIVNNSAITSLENWTDFFSNPETFSSLPANRAYRPMVTFLNAVDYSISGELNPTTFHIHIFFWHLVTVFLFLILVVHLSKKVNFLLDFKTKVFIVFTSLFFATHTINAETINYICARSDSFSTLFVLVSLLLFINQKTRKYYLYLPSFLIGIWTKQTAVMFIPILFFYIILFEPKTHYELAKSSISRWITSVIKIMWVPTIFGAALFLVNQLYLTPSSTVSSNFNVTKFEYVSTQFYVILHYFGNFILPTDLSADPDIEIISPWYDKRILLGLFLILTLIFTAFKCAKNQKTRPIAFGIAWFFVALLPTSLVPLFQIANDHRMFFPFMGIFIAVGFTAFHYYKLIKKQQYKWSFVIVVLLLISSYSVGTHERNKVWSSTESLWYDVTIKSPNNGRGLMNYGLSLMAKGDYDNAEVYFIQAHEKSPNWYTVKINLAILYGAKGDKKQAENFFNQAINLNSSAPDPEYYYARYLFKNNQYEKALSLVNKALAKSPNHLSSMSLKEALIPYTKSKNEQVEILIMQLNNDPQNEDIILNLTEKLYTLQRYDEAILYCENAIEINIKSKFVYNNLCACYNQKEEWLKAKSACEKALILDPDFQLAKNNLNWALGGLNK
jgi:tetratricopeptide (TPR) repeat protein